MAFSHKCLQLLSFLSLLFSVKSESFVLNKRSQHHPLHTMHTPQAMLLLSFVFFFCLTFTFSQLKIKLDCEGGSVFGSNNSIKNVLVKIQIRMCISRASIRIVIRLTVLKRIC